ncbi:MAG: hypothetical protein ACREU7_00890, partial [Burkholderiales bacterium]
PNAVFVEISANAQKTVANLMLMAPPPKLTKHPGTAGCGGPDRSKRHSGDARRAALKIGTDGAVCQRIGGRDRRPGNAAGDDHEVNDHRRKAMRLLCLTDTELALHHPTGVGVGRGMRSQRRMAHGDHQREEQNAAACGECHVFILAG